MMYYYAALNEVVSKEKCTEDAFEPLMAEFGILKLMSDPKKNQNHIIGDSSPIFLMLYYKKNS